MTLEEFEDSFEDFALAMNDPRLSRMKMHSIEEILFLALVGLICGCEGWRSLEKFGKLKLKMLRKFYSYKNGVPSDDTLRRLFRRLSPLGFKEFFQKWLKEIDLPALLIHSEDDLGQRFISIDGKISRGSEKKSGRQLNTVSAYASEDHIILGQQKALDKSNEITAIPKLLEIINVKDAVITIDAMGCQREICELIIKKAGDFCIAIKANQESLHNDIIDAFTEAHKSKPLSIIQSSTTDKGHGRKEIRHYEIMACPEEIQEDHNWPGLKTIGKVTTIREDKGSRTESVRYYITSAECDIKLISRAIRSHWAIENNLHWILDTAFKDDESKIRKGNAPENITIMKHLALNLLKKAQEKRESIKLLRASAGWDDQTLFRILSKVGEI